jgi:hypothetical protein
MPDSPLGQQMSHGDEGFARREEQEQRVGTAPERPIEHYLTEAEETQLRRPPRPAASRRT